MKKYIITKVFAEQNIVLSLDAFNKNNDNTEESS